MTFHGSVYEYLRNSFFDAKAFDSTGVSPFRLNNFGASFGGPVIRNKLFFFANYEGCPPGVLSIHQRLRAHRRLSRPSGAEVAGAGAAHQRLPGGKHANRRSQCAALDQQRPDPDKRRRWLVSRRLRNEQ